MIDLNTFLECNDRFYLPTRKYSLKLTTLANIIRIKIKTVSIRTFTVMFTFDFTVDNFDKLLPKWQLFEFSLKSD